MSIIKLNDEPCGYDPFKKMNECKHEWINSEDILSCKNCGAISFANTMKTRTQMIEGLEAIEDGITLSKCVEYITPKCFLEMMQVIRSQEKKIELLREKALAVVINIEWLRDNEHYPDQFLVRKDGLLIAIDSMQELRKALAATSPDKVEEL